MEFSKSATSNIVLQLSDYMTAASRGRNPDAQLFAWKPCAGASRHQDSLKMKPPKQLVIGLCWYVCWSSKKEAINSVHMYVILWKLQNIHKCVMQAEPADLDQCAAKHTFSHSFMILGENAVDSDVGVICGKCEAGMLVLASLE
ncbi:jg17056 [Pararge aegeria aegeria]|uniref:Jg17056 protein n=1 Tax=Pararge aegeria aegeria TaxID=348720 RepID=A0A8S4R0T3_9NEOP|nr:jg17056 [Pararge aegeria aegeria]